MKEETIPIVQPLQCIKLEHSNVLIECFPQVTMSEKLAALSLCSHPISNASKRFN
jgi:hypothetical protein